MKDKQVKIFNNQFLKIMLRHPKYLSNNLLDPQDNLRLA